MPSKFEALADDDESDGREEDFDNHDERLSDIPSYEDLSMTRVDEETVLSAVYGNDFVKKDGPWGSKIMSVIVRPPDISSSKVGSTVVLNIQIGKKYPYFQPKVNLSDVKGLSNEEQAELTKHLIERCLDLASNGSVMVCELVQVTEDFLHSHNIDPTMSAYDTMKAREAEEKKILMEKEKKLISFMDVDERKKIDRHFSDTGERYDTLFDSAAKVRIQRELDRQDAALNDIHGNVPFNDLNDIHDLSDSEDLNMTLREEEDDDYDDDFQFDEPTNGKGSSSRYNSDFIELGLIGRGGGGTVFKVRNRLDRRIYAVKKVMLLSEQGKMNKVGKLENSKLRREVTTISRMTHRHIVRYYQAWVEGADKIENEEGEDLEEVEDIAEGFLSEGDASKSQSDTSSKIGESEKGFWGKRPSSSTDLGNFRGDSDGDPSWSSDISSTSISINESERRTKADMRAFDSDEESIFPGGPLLGFENHSYSDLFKAGVKKESTNSSSDDLGFHSSMMDHLSSQMLKGSNSILYIQMEYCPRQLMTLMGTIEHNQGFKMIRQVLEALVYIHKRKIIHRDLKPGNIFLDAEHNVRLGDFGLATTRTKKTDIVSPTSDGDDKKDHEKIDMDSLHDDTITGGVGTTFYIAPEQAGTQYSGKGRNDYDMKADIFSLGIIIFEMFFSFSTKMERATILMQLRGDTVGSKSSHHSKKEVSMSSISTQKDSIQYIVDSEDWRQVAKQRFPKAFMDTPENIQKLILWCLERSPEKRPSAEQLLASDLIPRQMDLDHRYLKEALQSIANPESDSHEQIIKALFNRNVMQHVEITYDTDDVAKAQKQIRSSKHGSRKKNPIELLGKSLDQIGGFTSGDVQGFHSSAMNLLSMSAATSTLRRARGAGKIAKGGVLRQSTQHAATVLAMCSATAAAATGHPVGINGADPRVIKYVCDQLTFIFESHGAIPLRPPLLRPKGENDSSTANGSTQPAEVINGRGHNLLLPEDLQVNFARTIGRGGGALSNVKRYEIGTSYLKSISGGHPRQFLEASFDIVLESQQSKSELFFAEIIMVICQAFNILSPRKDFNMDTSACTEIVHPMWILRLTHTRLADAILDICGVPAKEALRQFCYHILTCCSAPPPNLLWIKSSDGKKIRGKKRKDTKKVCNGLIDNAILDHGLPKGAAARLRAFLNSGCLPLPLDINAALIALRDGTKKLRSMDDQRHNIPRRQKRYEDVARGLNTIKKSIEALKIMEIKVSNEIIEGENHQFPAYICLDLGLRQPAQHYHGHIYFQAIMLPEGPQSIVSNDTLLSDEGNGIKIAEGGRFDELVRRFRPPGNFASSDVNKYTSAPIPVCTGVRFFIGPFVERIYVEAALRSRKESEKSTLLTSESDVLRRLLAIPDLLQKGSVQCLIVGANGFDSASLCERAMVASHLWSNGISAEFIPHSGVILSLLKRSAIDTGATVPDTNEWTLDQICDLCCLLHIPFVVVVQQHLLRERKSVRLRQTTDLSSVQNGCHEKFVHLNNIASEIKEILSSSTRTLRSIPNDKNEYDNNIPASPFDRQSSTIQRETSTIRPRSISTSSPDLEYIYVDSDQFYLDPDKTGSGKDPKLKNILKVIKKVQLKADSFIQNELHKTFITVELPFRICREFNSVAMFGSGISIVASTADFQTKHPKYRKTLKTFAMCLDFMVRRFSESTSSSGSSNTGSRSSHKESILSILVYAQSDDRFDLLTLDVKHDSMNVKQSDSSSHKKKERSGRYR